MNDSAKMFFYDLFFSSQISFCDLSDDFGFNHLFWIEFALILLLVINVMRLLLKNVTDQELLVAVTD